MVSAIIHIGGFYAVYLFLRSSKPEIVYVQAELWSGEYGAISPIQNDTPGLNAPKRDSAPPNQQNNQNSAVKESRGDEIGLEKQRKEKLAKEKLAKEKLAKEKAEKQRKEKLAKEKLAKEKAEKERVIAQQRSEEVKRLKNALAGMNLNEVPKGGNNNKTVAGVEGGSEDGKRMGELADYAEQIRSKIRRKIIFDLRKVAGNPKVVFTVERANGRYEKIRLKKSSGNLKWDSAVKDAIKRSVPLPNPTGDDMLVLPNELLLSFTPRD